MSLPAPTDKRILVASDESASRRKVNDACRSWGYEVTAVSDCTAAAMILNGNQAPSIAIIDWPVASPGEWQTHEPLFPLKAGRTDSPLYIILLSAPGSKDEESGGVRPEADDYVSKPFEPRELRARIQLGFRVVRLQAALEERVLELETALGRVKNLQGLLPMCSYCKRIRNDRNYWQQVESYIAEHSGAEFTHGVCPHCYETIVKPELEHLRAL